MKKPRGDSIWLLGLSILVIIGLVLSRTDHLEGAEGALFRLLAPAEQALSTVGKGFSDMFQTVRDLRELRERNRQLTDLVNDLAVENVRLKEVEAENEILRQLLQFADSSAGREFLAAEVRVRVVGREPNNLLRYIVIAAGRDDGMAKGMPVVTERGLVGRIDEVYPKASRVRLINDLDSSVNALVQRTRATGIVRGGVDGRLTMDFLPPGNEEVISVGDKILTSGLGGGFPRQLVIGEVTELDQKDYEMFQTAEVRPSVDFDRLEIVLVITNFIPLDVTTESRPEPTQSPAPTPMPE